VRRRVSEFFIESAIRLSGLLVIVFVFLIFLFLLKDSLALFRSTLWAGPVGRNWLPISEPPQFGMVPLFLGSLYVTIGAILICVPVGVATALFIGEVAPKSIKTVLKSLIEVLAAIPSVVLGFIGIVWLGPFLGPRCACPPDVRPDRSLLLAFMALPTIISISRTPSTACPGLSERPSAWAPRDGRPCGGLSFRPPRPDHCCIMLGIGRVIGETMVS